jgi:hypothetical protein
VVSDLIDLFGADLAVLGLHFGDAAEVPWNVDRMNYYSNFIGFPTYMIDGELDSWAGNPPWSAWDPDTVARLAVPTDVTIELSAAPGGMPEVWDITATVCIEPGGTGKSMRIHLVEVLDNYPAGHYFDRNCTRQAAATEDIVLAAGACQEVTRTFTFDATSMAQFDDISIIGWAQDDLALGPAEVFQAAQMHTPFWTEEVFADGFEDGTTNSWDAVVP